MEQDASRSAEGRYKAVSLDEMPSHEASVYLRNRRRKALLFVTLPGLVLGTATFATAYSAGWLDGSGGSCTPRQISAPPRESFDVIVLNANSGSDGLGSKVAGRLGERGFKVVQVGNAPDSVYVKNAAQINYGKDGLAAALLLQKQIPGASLRFDGRAGTGAQVTLGYGFTDLIPESLPPAPAPSEITLNVYNTTSAEGLAKRVADELKERQFKIKNVGNDPQKSWIATGSGQVRYGPSSDRAIERLKPYLPGFDFARDENRQGDIDVVLGANFKALAPLNAIPAVEPWTRPTEIVAEPCSG